LVVAEKIAKIWEILSLLWNLIITRDLKYPSHPPSLELNSDALWRGERVDVGECLSFLVCFSFGYHQHHVQN
jgi:hypothetical protein